MSFLDKIIELDHKLLIFLNSLGTEQWDSFWLLITNKLTWIPLYLVLLFLLFKYHGWKKTLVLLVMISILVAFSDQFVNLIKNSAHRLRPNNDPTIKHSLRHVLNSKGYSFLSGHATTSFAVATYLILLLKKDFKPILFVLVWPLLFMYSRIYLGVHFPIDVVSGLILGISIGFIFYYLSLFVLSKTKI